MERNRIICAQVWAVQGWVTSEERGTKVESSRVKHVKACSVQGWVTSAVEQASGREEPLL